MIIATNAEAADIRWELQHRRLTLEYIAEVRRAINDDHVAFPAGTVINYLEGLREVP